MEPNEVKTPGHRSFRKSAFAVVIIVAGCILLLFNIGLISPEIKHIFFSWQMLLIVIGIVSLLSSDNRTPGYVLISIGAIFLLPEIFDFTFKVSHLIVPAILIAIGIILLLKRVPSRTGHQPFLRTPDSPHPLENGYVHEENFFSGSKQRFDQEVFRGGNISCVFGGSELDLTRTTLAEGNNALEITTIFGGVTLIVPSDWKIILRTTSIFGGFSDKRVHIKESGDISRVLVIKGSTIFGGGEIKSY
ncbi:MAG: LiaF domain-containing protein [bacterium]